MVMTAGSYDNQAVKTIFIVGSYGEPAVTRVDDMKRW
jgi:hypothetical protein